MNDAICRNAGDGSVVTHTANRGRPRIPKDLGGCIGVLVHWAQLWGGRPAPPATEGRTAAATPGTQAGSSEAAKRWRHLAGFGSRTSGKFRVNRRPRDFYAAGTSTAATANCPAGRTRSANSAAAATAPRCSVVGRRREAPGPPPVDAVMSDQEPDLAAVAKSVSRARRNTRRQIPDEKLSEVADVYRANPTRPTAAVAERFGLALRTASLYVKRAREAGLLEEVRRGEHR